MGNLKNKKTNILSGVIIAGTIIVILSLAVFLIWYIKGGNDESPRETKDSARQEETVADDSSGAEENIPGEADNEQTEEKPEETLVNPENEPESETEAEAAPVPGPEPEEPSQVDVMMADMTVHEKVCQLFMVYPSAIVGTNPVTSAGDMTKAALEQNPVGGLVYNMTNMQSQEQVRQMADNSQSFVEIPLFIACDEEGGRVGRLMFTVGTTKIGAMLGYKDQGTEKAYENAFTIASDMSRCGLNLNLAPVADVWSNPANTVIGDRAYSDDYEEAAQLVAAAVEGFHEGGVGCTLKHFPGHGDTLEDTHNGLAHVYKTLDELREGEFLPFKAGIEAGADAIMLGHMIVSDVSDMPVIFSHTIVTDILRGELGFDGVVMTDALEMKAIRDNYTSGEASLLCLDTGVDIILCPIDFNDAVTTVEKAVESGRLSEERIDESVRRILQAKINMGLIAESEP